MDIGQTQVPSCKFQEQSGKQDTQLAISGNSFRMRQPLKSMTGCVARVFFFFFENVAEFYASLSSQAVLIVPRGHLA